MDHAASIILDATGCTEQAHTAVAGLVASGWSAPQDVPSPAPSATPIGSSTLADVPAGAVLTAHTDGACSGNPGPGGWSVVFSHVEQVVAEFSGSAAASTSNRMELTAVLEAIRRAPAGMALEIATDSRNVIGWLAGGWKRNQPAIAALCAEIDATRDGLAAQGGSVVFRHVRGHQGTVLNERADQLATGAIRT